MNDHSERWITVGRLIADRIDALGLTKAELLRRSNLSDKTLAGYLAGHPIRRADKKRDLCAALGWSIDSIERILDEQPPKLMDESKEGAMRSRLTRVEMELEEATHEVMAKQDQAHALREEIIYLSSELALIEHKQASVASAIETLERAIGGGPAVDELRAVISRALDMPASTDNE